MVYFSVNTGLETVCWPACFRTFYFRTTEYVLNETETVAYRCCDGWQQSHNETGCTQR